MVVKTSCLRSWPGKVMRMEERYEIKVSELHKVKCKNEAELGETTTGGSL